MNRLLGLALGGALALAVGQGIGRFAYTPILPPMAEALGLSRGAAGLIASANFLGYLLGALLAATPWLGGARRAWMLGGLALSGLTTAAMGLAASLPLFLALRFLGGGASAVLLVLASTLVLDRLTAAGRAPLGDLLFTGIGAGIAFSAAFVALLAQMGLGWQGLWLGCGLVSLACLPVVGWLIPPLPGPSHAPTGGGTAPRLPWPAGWKRLLGSYGLFGIGYVVTATFMVAMVRENPQTRPIEPFVWLLTGLAAIPSLPIWTWAGRRLGLTRALALAYLVEGISVALAALWPGPAGMVLSAAGLGVTLLGITALGLMVARRLAARLSPDHARRAVGLMTASFGLGQIAGPWIAGVVGDATGGFAIPVLGAAAALMASAALAAALPRD